MRSCGKSALSSAEFRGGDYRGDGETRPPNISPPDQGLCPKTLLGALPPDPRPPTIHKKLLPLAELHELNFIAV